MIESHKIIAFITLSVLLTLLNFRVGFVRTRHVDAEEKYKT